MSFMNPRLLYLEWLRVYIHAEDARKVRFIHKTVATLQKQSNSHGLRVRCSTRVKLEGFREVAFPNPPNQLFSLRILEFG